MARLRRLGETLTAVLADRYLHAARTPSDINEHLPEFVAICNELRATKVIELGTRGGVSTVAWLHAMELNDGHLWSVDISPAPQLDSDRWTFLRGDDRSQVILDLLPAQVDVVFIDTSHEFEHTATELDLYAPRVRPGGRIVLHDTEVEQPDFVPPGVPFPVKVAVGEFCAARGWQWTNRTYNNGLGIIEVPLLLDRGEG